IYAGSVFTIDSGTGALVLGGAGDGVDSFSGGQGILNYYGGTLNFAQVTSGGSNSFATVNIYTNSFAPQIVGGVDASIEVDYLSGGTFAYSGSDNYSGGMSVDNGTTLEFSSGTFNLDTLASRQIDVGDQTNSTGVVIITNNAHVHAGSLEVGEGVGSSGTLSIDSGTLITDSDLTIGQLGTGTLNMTGGTIDSNRVTIGGGSTGTATISGGTWNDGSAFLVGYSGTGVLNIQGGAVNEAGTVSIGLNLHYAGTVNVSSGTLSADNFTIGYSGSGTLNVTGGLVTGTDPNSDNLIGISPPSYGPGTGVVNVSSGTFNLAGVAYYGNDGNGTLNLTGGYVSDNKAFLGGRPWDTGTTGVGTATVSSGTWNNDVYLVLGETGQGTLNISGGVVTVNGGLGTIYLGDSALGTGVLNFSGGTINAADVTAGAGTATINIYANSFAPQIVGSVNSNISVNYLSGGTFVYSGSDNYSGLTSVDEGTTLKFDGGTFNLNNSNSSSGQFTIAHYNGNDTGTVIITNNAYVEAPSFWVAVGTSSTGTLIINSGTLMVNGSLYIGSDGAGILNMTGGTLDSIGGSIGSSQGSSGTATISGGVWNDSNYIAVGGGGTGVLNIQGGSVIETDVVYIASGTTGTVNVSSGTLSADYFRIGNSGTGTLNVTGGLVTGTDPNAPTIFGVTGPGSSLGVGVANVSSGTFSVAGAAYYGYNGSGTLNVTGGYVSDDTATLGGYYTDTNDTGAGTATVSSGTWNTANQLFVGYSGSGTLNLTGGHISDLQAFIGGYYGNGTTGVGTVTVSGGTWDTSLNVVVGVTGSGTLNISGGVVTVDSGVGTITLGDRAGSQGTLNFSGGTLDVADVTSGSGTAIVNFTTLAGGTSTFAPDITGAVAVNQTGAGQTIITGVNTYTGPTTITAGELTVNGSITSAATVTTGTLNGSGTTSNVTVNNGGVLGGTLHSGVVTVTAGGKVTAGDAPGTNTMTSLTLTGSATYMEQIVVPGGGSYTGTGNHPIAGTDYGQTILTGSGSGQTVVSLDSTSAILQLNVTGPLPAGGLATTGNPYTPGASNSTLDNYFILHLSDGTDVSSGRFAEVTLDGVNFVTIDYSATNLVGGDGVGTFTLDGQGWVISYTGFEADNSTIGGDDVVLTAIPEPSVYALLALGGLGLVMGARRRRR
ncbi:MAG: autotransporter-associated beta strand repeat-containing protein, partial [Chthoniobacteraceae bacterium]